MLLVAMCLGFTGCASITDKLENNIVCVAGKAEGRVDSMRGMFGITTKLANGAIACPASK